MLSKTSAYLKSYDGETKWIYFLNKDDEWFEKYDDIEKERDCKTNHRESYGGEATDFQDIKMREVRCNYTCLAIMLIDFFLKRNENYYLQAFF